MAKKKKPALEKTLFFHSTKYLWPPRLEKTLQRYRLMSDDDGHEYLVEVGEERNFYEWLHAGPYWEDYKGKVFESLGDHFSTYSFCDPREI